MTESENRALQLHQKLLDDNGFRISREELMELFVTENMHNNVSEEPSISFGLLRKFGFRPGICSALKTNVATGLDTEQDIALREKIYGKNARHQRKTRGVCDMICEVFQDFILKVLIVAAVVSTTLGCVQHGVAEGFQEGAGIMFAIVIIVVVTVGNDYAKEKKFQELMSQADVKPITVKRNGELSTIDSEELVVGDIVEIGYGQAVPADVLVITSAECFTSEAALTGEPDDLPKEPVDETNPKGDPFMLQGSEVQKGKATGVVLAVGDNTNQGRAGLSMNIEAEETPLQMKLNSIAEGIGKVGLTVAILTLLAIIVTTLIKTAKDPDSDFGIDFWKDIANGFVIAITVIVVAIPEGLPLAVTISLAFSVAQMQKENNLVRKLQSSETMGNANEICTDKTGTLTQNRMTVASAYLETQVREGTDPDMFSRLVSSEDIADATIMNTTAYYEFKKDADGNQTTEEVGSGNVTELGLLNYLRDSGVAVKDTIATRTEMSTAGVEMQIPLNSERKRSTIVLPKGDGFRIYCKGAPEVVIEYCTEMVYAGGDRRELTDDAKQALLEAQKAYANRALRTLLVTYRDVSVDEWEQIKGDENKEALAESNLVVVAMFGLKDPLRPGIKEAVETCNKAGINVRMVTGDNKDTARAISIEAGILTQADLDPE
jgi:calcium-translocating P-type ATPase